MSFEKHKVDELRAVAEFYGVDLSNAKNKPAIIKEIELDGVEYEDAVKNVLDPEPVEDEVAAPAAAPVVDDRPKTIVRMTRKNPTYEAEANGNIYRFTSDNPYVLLPEDDADVILEREEGFRVASPKEAREFYG